MLNIPDPIKELFKRDNVLKNLRVTFPNGEHDDITNDQIIKESMNFTESLASGSPVVFGLCEASVISFECVGVENINGMQIFVYIEIDISSLTAAQKAQWGQTSSDVPFTFYPVPLGLFVVDECAREANMNIRQVTAYSPYFYDIDDVTAFSKMNPYDQKKAVFANWGTNKQIGVDYWNLAILFGQDIFDYHDVDPQALDLNPQVTKYTSHEETERVIEGTLKNGNRGKVRVKIRENKFFRIDLNDRDYSGTVWVVYDSKHLPWEGDAIWWWGSADKHSVQNINKTLRDIKSELKSRFKNIDNETDVYKWLNERYKNYYGRSYYNWKLPKNGNPVAPNSEIATDVEYLRLNSFFALNGEPVVEFPMQIDIIFEYQQNDVWYEVINESFDFTDNDHVELYKINPKNSNLINYWNISIGMLGVFNSVEENGRYSFAKVFEDMDGSVIIRSILEASGLFGGVGRNGYMRTYNITSAIKLLPSYEIYPTPASEYPSSSVLYPSSSDDKMNLTRADYIEVWYDEYLTNYGSIYVRYKDANDRDAEYTEYLVDEDEALLLPVYDLSGNIIFADTHTEEDVHGLIAIIKANINTLRYVKADITMRALPYMEIGDMLFVKAKDDTFATPILTQTITGIQDLRNAISSQS